MSTNDTTDTNALPDFAPVPQSSMGQTLNEQGYYVGRVERNLYWVTDGVYQRRRPSATTSSARSTRSRRRTA